jgi:hypothetical protein
MRLIGVMCLLAALAGGCEKKSEAPAQPIRHDSKIDGSAYVTERALNDEIIQDQTKVSKNYQKAIESAPKPASPATAPAVANAPAETPASAPAKSAALASKTPLAAGTPKTPAPASAPAAAAAPAGTPAATPPFEAGPKGVVKRMTRGALREESQRANQEP